MTKQQPWFFEQRAVAFAKLVLTKHHDVRPYAGAAVGNLDLLAEIRTDGNSTQRRLFGVQIVAYMDLPDIRNADERVSWPLRDPFVATLPLCAFVIGVRKPEGIYRWVVEPVVENGRARLDRRARSIRDVEASWQPLDDAGADRLIGQVNAYYDALNGGSTPKAHGRHSKTES